MFNRCVELNRYFHERSFSNDIFLCKPSYKIVYMQQFLQYEKSYWVVTCLSYLNKVHTIVQKQFEVVAYLFFFLGNKTPLNHFAARQDKKSRVTEQIDNFPYCIILFNEIEFRLINYVSAMIGISDTCSMNPQKMLHISLYA